MTGGLFATRSTGGRFPIGSAGSVQGFQLLNSNPNFSLVCTNADPDDCHWELRARRFIGTRELFLKPASPLEHLRR